MKQARGTGGRIAQEVVQITGQRSDLVVHELDGGLGEFMMEILSH